MWDRTALVNARDNQPLPGVGPVSSWLPLQRTPLYSVALLITNVSGTDSSAIMRYNSLQVTPTSGSATVSSS
jgi:hypothetical protein